MNENQIKVEIEKQTYRLEEMADAMQQSIDNAMNVASEQQSLIDVLTASDKANDFTELVESCKQQIIDIENQVKILAFRKNLLAIVINACKDDEKTEEIVSVLLDALAVFNKHNDMQMS